MGAAGVDSTRHAVQPVAVRAQLAIPPRPGPGTQPGTTAGPRADLSDRPVEARFVGDLVVSDEDRRPRAARVIVLEPGEKSEKV